MNETCRTPLVKSFTISRILRKMGDFGAIVERCLERRLESSGKTKVEEVNWDDIHAATVDAMKEIQEEYFEEPANSGILLQSMRDIDGGRTRPAEEVIREFERMAS